MGETTTKRLVRRSSIWIGVVLFVLLAAVVWIVATTNHKLSIVASSHGLSATDGEIPVQLRAVSAFDASQILYTSDQTATVKDGKLAVSWDVPTDAKKQAAFVEICAADSASEQTNTVSKECVSTNNVAYTKISCPYAVPANATSWLSTFTSTNKLDDTQKIGCGADTNFGDTSLSAKLATAQSSGLVLSGNGILTIKDGQLVTQTGNEFLATLTNTLTPTEKVTYVTTNVPVPGAIGPSGVNGQNGTNGSDGAAGATGAVGATGTTGLQGTSGVLTTSNGGLVLTGTDLSLDTSCATGQILKWDGATWTCAVDIDTNTDSQSLSIAADQLAISGGNSVDLSAYLDNTDSQTLSWDDSSRTLSLTNGGSVVVSDANSGGTVTSITAGTGLTGGVITGTGAINLSNIGSAGTYGSSTSIPVLTTDAQGRITAVTTTPIPTATTSTTGLLNSTDWNIFNAKQNSLTFNGNGLFSQSGGIISGATCLTVGQTLVWNGSAYVCAANGQTYTADNGLTLTGTNLELGGTLTHATTIDGTASTYGLSLTNSALNLDSTNTTGTTGVVNVNGIRFISTYGVNNNFIGTSSGNTTTTGNANVGLGGYTLSSNTSGNYNVGVGYASLYYNTDGSFNTGIGDYSLYRNTSGTSNMAVGYYTLLNNTTGSDNVGMGVSALRVLTTGSRNMGIGRQAFYNPAGSTGLTTGNDNITIGYSSGNTVTTGSNNLSIGSNTTVQNGTLSNQMNIKNIIFGTGLSGTLVAPAGNIGIGTATPNSKLEIASGAAGNSGLRFTSLDASSTAAASNGKVLTVNATGDVILTSDIGATCASATVLAGSICNGGNATGALMVIGTTDAQPLSLTAGNVEGVRILANGNVGIKSLVAQSTLQVNGTVAITPTMALAGASSQGTAVPFTTQNSYIGLTPTTGNSDYKLPDPTTVPGRIYYIRNNSNTIAATLGTAGASLFNGSSNTAFATYGLGNNSAGKTIIVISDGLNWNIGQLN